MQKATIGVGALLLATGGAAHAGITLYVGQDAGFTATDTAFFDDTVLDGGGTTATIPGIDTHGMNFRSIHVNESSGFWGYAFPGGDGTESCYFNGGQNDIMAFSRLDSADFDTVEMQIGAGWGGPNIYAWFTVWNNGAQVASFDLDTTYGTYVGITGGGFDEVRFAGYNDAGTRDAHIETNYSAGALDNVSYGSLIPSPAAIALFGLAGLTTSRRRR